MFFVGIKYYSSSKKIEELYSQAIEQQDELSINRFIKNCKNTKNYDKVLLLKDSINFSNITITNDYDNILDYQSFIDECLTPYYRKLASDSLEKYFYHEILFKQTYILIDSFLTNYPHSIYSDSIKSLNDSIRNNLNSNFIKYSTINNYNKHDKDLIISLLNYLKENQNLGIRVNFNVDLENDENIDLFKKFNTSEKYYTIEKYYTDLFHEPPSHDMFLQHYANIYNSLKQKLSEYAVYNIEKIIGTKYYTPILLKNSSPNSAYIDLNISYGLDYIDNNYTSRANITDAMYRWYEITNINYLLNDINFRNTANLIALENNKTDEKSVIPRLNIRFTVEIIIPEKNISEKIEKLSFNKTSSDKYYQEYFKYIFEEYTSLAINNINNNVNP